MDPGSIATLSETTKHVLDGFFAYPLIVAVGAVLMRIRVKQELAIAEGNPPRTLTWRGFRAARTSRWWVMTHIIKTQDGWHLFDRILFSIAIVGAAIAAVTFVVGTTMALAS